MQYKIIIKTIEEKEIKSEEYVVTGEGEDGKSKYGYVPINKIEEVETEIYSQIKEDKIELKDVIDAFNQ